MTTLVGCLLASLVCSAGDAPLRIAAEPADARRIQVEATLTPAQATIAATGEVERSVGERLLKVVLLDAEAAPSASALLGSYELAGRTLTFRPRFALTPGCTYRATLVGADGEAIATADYRLPQIEVGAAAEVVACYPAGDQVPANLLKFYLCFSRPMREGPAIFDQVQLLDESGKTLEAPWRLTELWSDDATRLTLYVHPGRIKQGVNLREQIGPVLAPGRKYTLVVTTAVRSADGRPLASEYRRSFTATEEDRTSPEPARWRLALPAESSRDALVVDTDEPLDRFLLARCLHVKDAADRDVAGRVDIEAGEQCWKFVPAQAWQDTPYSLVIDPILEDLAGNTPVRRFDTDTQERAGLTPNLRRTFWPDRAAR